MFYFFFLSSIVGLATATLIYVIMFSEKSLLKSRIRKIGKKRRLYVKSIAKNIAEIIGGFKKDNEKNKILIQKTKLMLMQAGEDSNENTVLIFEGRKILIMLIMAIFLVLALFIVGFKPLNCAIAIFVLLLVYKIPEFLLKQKIETRQKEFVRNLPDAIDLLSICIRAGLGLDAALNRVAKEFKLTSKVVAAEFERLNRDVLSGLTKQEAYRNMAICNPNPEVKSFVALLVQTDKLGTSITQSLEAYCDSVRTRKRQRVEELSQKASGKMTIPMVLFMLPAIFIIILYPALIKINTNMHF